MFRWFAGYTGLMMSVKLDEVKLRADIQQVIADYGRQVELNDGANHIHVWCSPPVTAKSLSGQDNMIITEAVNFIIPSLYCTIVPALGYKIIDGAITYRITDVKPLDAGTIVIAYKITAER